MNYKHNCTKGPAPEIMNGSDNGWATCTMQRDGLHVVVTAPHASEMDNGEWDHPEKVHEAEANAQLIAEAFTVLHETGMTPRELAEEMYKAVREQARQQDRAEIAALKAEVERLRKATAEVLEGEDLGLITWDCQCEEEIGITCGCCQAFEQLSAALDKKHRPCP